MPLFSRVRDTRARYTRARRGKTLQKMRFSWVDPLDRDFLSGGISALAPCGSPERRTGPLPLSRSKYSMVNDLSISECLVKSALFPRFFLLVPAREWAGDQSIELLSEAFICAAYAA